MQKFSSYVLKYIIIALVVLAILAGGMFILQKKSPVIGPGESVAPTPTPEVALTTWNDPAGFSFQYPKDLTVDNNEEDNDNYAHVELTHKDHPGSIIVWVSDPPRVWPPKEGTSIDTTLGGQPAKKILIASPSAKIIVGMLFDGLLFKVEGTFTNKEYWQPIEDTIVKSFTFIEDTSAPSTGGEAVDEEEVVQ